MPHVYLGVDVSKDWIDASFPDRDARLPNSQLARFADEAARAGAVVIFEATGRYDRPLREALAAAGVPWCRLPPQNPRHLARLLRVQAKSDAADARLLRRYGEVLRPEPDAPQDEPARAALKELVTRRAALVRMAQAEACRSSQALPDQIAASIRRITQVLKAEIARFDALITAEIAGQARLAETARRLRTAPGIGPVTAALLLAALPELGRTSPQSIAALTGLAPFDNQSGKWHGRRRCRGGRPEIRRALYSAGMQASRGHGPLTGLRTRLTAAGKPTKLAITACARRLLVILNAMIRDGTDFQTG